MKPNSIIRFAGALACAGVLHVSAASAGNEKVIYSFCSKKSCTDGGLPAAGLINVNGTLYGTTYAGGGRGCGGGGCGTVFSITPSGTETVLHAFKGGSDGASPFLGLIDVKGTLYGTTSAGGGGKGAACVELGGCGTVFSVTPSGKETVLYAFKGVNSNGIFPVAGLIYVGGTLYGTTQAGGTTDLGTVFSVDPKTGAEKVLHSFGSGSDGAYPYAGLINVEGTLYGTTEVGGTFNNGTVFSVHPATGKEKVVYSFGTNDPGTDGSTPEGGLIDVNGTLYGTTSLGGANCVSEGGCGTVFSIDLTTGAEKVVHSFSDNGKDGDEPPAGLIDVKGTLYGTTSAGGGRGCGGGGCGTVFSITPSGTETVLYAFKGGSDGIGPMAGLINVKGTLYGTTTGGGTGSCTNISPEGCGTVFSVKP